MEQKQKALLLTAVVAVILTLGLTLGFSPSVNLHDRILDVVQLPRKAFSYILGKHPTSPHAESFELPPESVMTGEDAAVPQTPALPQQPPQTGETVTTPIDFFDKDDPIDLTPSPAPGDAPDDTTPQEPPHTAELPVNQLPDNILE